MPGPDPALSGFVLLDETEHAALLAEVAELRAAGRDLLAQIELAGMVRRNQDREVAGLRAYSARLLAWVREAVVCLPLTEREIRVELALEGLLLFGTGGECHSPPEAPPVGSVCATGGGGGG